MPAIEIAPFRIGKPIELSVPGLRLRAGKITLLLGDNGSGKSTLIQHLVSHPSLAHAVGVAPGAPHRRRATFARSWQHARLLPALSIAEHAELSDASRLGLTRWFSVARKNRLERRDYAYEPLIHELGLGSVLFSPSNTLALSEQKRAALYLALRADTPALLLDEPLAGLDEANRDRAIDIVLSEALRRPVLITDQSADNAWLKRSEAEIFRLKDGRVTAYVEDAGDLMRPPGLSQIDALLSQSNRREIINWQGAEFEVVTFADPSEPGIDRKDAANEQLVFRDMDAPELRLTLDHSTLVVLRAANGWGKTSLLASLAEGRTRMGRSLSLESGSHRRPVSPEGLSNAGVRITAAGSVPFPSLSVRDHLRLLDAGMVPSTLDLRPRQNGQQLSGGEKATLISNASLGSRGASRVLLDEPFLGADEARSRQIVGAIREFVFAAAGHFCLLTLPARS